MDCLQVREPLNNLPVFIKFVNINIHHDPAAELIYDLTVMPDTSAMGIIIILFDGEKIV